MRLLVTRPEPGASATVQRLAGMGHEPTALPCLAITQRPARLPPHPAALIVTSGQAVPSLPARLHGVPVFCVGDATAAKLREAGFTRVESAQGDAEALATLVIARQVQGLHVLTVGERHGQKLAAELRAAGLSVLRRRVYTVSPLRVMPAAIRAALSTGHFEGALFYSAETARAFARLQPDGTAGMRAYALSQNVAKGLQGLPWAAILIARAPTEADLMALLA
ncbi:MULTISPECIES: uroporphyrinogen-III synthase [Acidocella]|uniref:uroporphyrinogen-III synthase n=1 Tax=Acidocella TaxID=50709 RepID=UPI00028E5477|nr:MULTISPECIES: uroporphyrinogen-III synthase [Acidocella]EKN01379.1 uroporphyrinogen III synthase HEM4 [Acidocella sp. MX-AZ02]WBO60899.1 uroporphyrinogen-III synthase [Acidocella sp. MX-AZ03]